MSAEDFNRAFNSVLYNIKNKRSALQLARYQAVTAALFKQAA